MPPYTSDQIASLPICRWTRLVHTTNNSIVHWNEKSESRDKWDGFSMIHDVCWVKKVSATFLRLFVCLCSSQWRIFHLYGDVTITGEGLQILTYTRHQWPLNSEGSSACHTYCVTGHPFIMIISEDPWHSQLLPSVWQWNLFLRLRSVAARIRKSNLPPARRTL